MLAVKIILSLIGIITIITVILLFFGVKSDKQTIESDFESVMKIDLPSNFEIVKNDTTIAIGDYGRTYEIKFNQIDFNALVKKIDLTKWKQANDQVYKYETRDHEGGFTIISILLAQQKLTYLYYQD